MALNTVTLNGRLPRFEGTFKAAEGDKKAFMSWNISVKRDFKPEGAQYYPEDLIRFKAFGAKADFINNFFNQGDGLIIQGKLQMDDDYEKDGQTVKGQMFVMVSDVFFAEGTSGEGKAAGGAKSSSAPSKPAPGKAPVGKPGIPKRPGGLPGKKTVFNK